MTLAIKSPDVRITPVDEYPTAAIPALAIHGFHENTPTSPDPASVPIEVVSEPPRAEIEPLSIVYFDIIPLPKGVKEDKSGELTFRPAEIIFPNERSHKLAAEIVAVTLGRGNIYNQMQRQLAEGEEIIDPLSLPPDVPLEIARSVEYDQNRYEYEYARQIRRSIGTVAAFHKHPETRPVNVSVELAERASILDKSAPGLGQPPRTEVERIVEMALRRPKTQSTLAVEKIIHKRGA